MSYLVFHLICGLISILLQIRDGGCDEQFTILYLVSGPIGLLVKIILKLI